MTAGTPGPPRSNAVFIALVAGVALAVGIGACASGTPARGARARGSAPSSSIDVSPKGGDANSAHGVAGLATTAETAIAPLPSTPIPTSKFATTKTDASWALCHRSYKATGSDVSKDVASMAAACEKQTKMKLVGKTITGKQADREKPQSYPFDANANHCYRVYAQAVEGIKDLDIVVKDSAGVIVGQDSTDDPSPVVLEDGAVCFAKDDRASIVVSVGMGTGAYAVQVWGD